MPDYRSDAGEAAEIEREIRARLDEALTARPPMSEVEREVAVALNVMSELLGRRAREAYAADYPRSEGLYDGAVMLWHELGRRGLPQLAEIIFDADDQ